MKTISKLVFWSQLLKLSVRLNRPIPLPQVAKGPEIQMLMLRFFNRVNSSIKSRYKTSDLRYHYKPLRTLKAEV